MAYLVIINAAFATFFFVQAVHWRGRARLAESRLAAFKKIVDEAYAEAQEEQMRREMESTAWPC